MPCTPKVRKPAPKESNTLSTPASSIAWRRVVSKSRSRSSTSAKYRPEMANVGLLTSLEPAVAIPHEHYGVAEVLLKRDLAEGYRGRRGSDFGQTRNGHRLSPV